MSLLLPIIPGTLPPGYCFSSWQQTLNDFASHMNAELADGCAFFNYGPDKPAPEFNVYPWLRTTDMRWYRFDGVWISPNPESGDPNIVRRWVTGDAGTIVADITAYDGGDGGAPSDRSGPMWEVDADFDGRSPMQAGAIPSANPPKSLLSAENYGEGAHLQGTQEVGPHTHPLNADPTIVNGDNIRVVTTGVGGPGLAMGLTAPPMTDLSVLPNKYTTVQQTMPVIHPVRGGYFLKRTARVYYAIP
jgi:hypothetical protein